MSCAGGAAAELPASLGRQAGGPDHIRSPEGWLHALAKGGALLGGFVFIAMTVMLVVTIVCRKLFAWQVPGDVEIVQMGAALASSYFFAWCHLMRGEVKVDFATNHLPQAWINALDGFGSLLVGTFGALLAWRSGALALASLRVGEQSAVLAWPVWIVQGLMVPGLALLALAGFHEAWRAFSACRPSAMVVAVQGPLERQP